MSNLIQEYIKQIQTKFDNGGATEHTYRITLETLLLGLSNQITVTNEHERITGVGMPDFTIKSKKDTTIPIGRIEAKDLHISLEEKRNEDQLKRYKNAFDNFVYTNNLTFIFYRNGKKVETVSLGNVTKGKIQRQTDDLFDNNIIKLENLLKEFLSFQGITITSPEKLAKAMAQKAQLIKFAIQHIFNQEDTSLLEGQYQAFKDLLVHDLTKEQFADMYAQTVAYGLFTARLYDPTLPTFSREEAEKLIPKSTPFIRWLFKQMSNDDEFDERIAYIIDDLVHIFLHCNVAEILKNYGKKTKMEDPIIHFYETFLGEYDSKMRKKRGVYYTPEPVVKFIVKGVDYLLKNEFGLSEGLADTTTVEKEFRLPLTDKRYTDGQKKEKKDVHRVQILDPATGTGTFLNEVVSYIHDNYFQGQQGLRNSYVSKDLLPRIRGFEILMASYTMAHLKLGLTLTDTGWKGTDRVNIYLTNSLEEPHDNLGTLFSQALAKESEQASKVKREQPIMVVMGNPPYSGESANKGEWIMSLMEAYKKEPGGKIKLQERNSKWVNDDYVKFIRYAEHFIEKNNEGIIAYICPHGFLDNPTFRGMRRKILDTFDTIYTIDLHGNTKKKETAPDGGKDENVFDIQQGVAITFFVKNNKKKNNELATVYHVDAYGKRNNKYDWLDNITIENIDFTTVENVKPQYLFVPKDYKLLGRYGKYISISDLFSINSVGIVTSRDSFVIDTHKTNLSNRIKDFFISDRDTILSKYDIRENKSRKINDTKLATKYDNNCITKVNYRPFDIKYIYYEKNFIERSRETVMKNFINRDNLCLCLCKQFKSGNSYQHILVSSHIIESSFVSNRTSEITYSNPLYLYNEDGTERKPNLKQTLIDNISEKLGATRTPDGQGDKKNTVGPEDIFDYTYAVLHSPTYRETYQEFLKTDFPRVPFTENIKTFWQLVELGNKLRTLHLMEGIERNQLTTTYPIEGNNTVEKIDKHSFQNNNVYINETQYFEGVSDIARNFWIGGYQPAQKRLKDRKEEKLRYEDIVHYQKIVYVLEQTHEIMQHIDKVELV